jgi:alkylation response protein AidB-like acyl-CoA dehydrogenase
MGSSLTDEQRDTIKASREFTEGEFPDLAQECDRREEFPRHLWKKACELGFVGFFIREAYGGAGLGFLEHCLINEEFWWVDPGIETSILSAMFGSEMIQLFGTEDQKRKWLPLRRGRPLRFLVTTSRAIHLVMMRLHCRTAPVKATLSV